MQWMRLCVVVMYWRYSEWVDFQLFSLRSVIRGRYLTAWNARSVKWCRIFYVCLNLTGLCYLAGRIDYSHTVIEYMLDKKHLCPSSLQYVIQIQPRSVWHCTSPLNVKPDFSMSIPYLHATCSLAFNEKLLGQSLTPLCIYRGVVAHFFAEIRWLLANIAMKSLTIVCELLQFTIHSIISPA